jgi:hypothetical protein
MEIVIQEYNSARGMVIEGLDIDVLGKGGGHFH